MEPTTTQNVTYQISGVDVAMAVALIFALAGAIFIGILVLRRRRSK